MDYSISLVRVVLLLFGNVMLLIAGLIVLNVKWQDSFAEPEPKAASRENIGNGIFLLITFLGVFAPIMLAKDRPKTVPPAEPAAPVAKFYRVAMPYADSSLPNQLGAGHWGGRLLCEVVEIKAGSTKDASDAALQLLKERGRLAPTFSNKGTVVPRSDLVVVAQP